MLSSISSAVPTQARVPVRSAAPRADQPAPTPAPPPDTLDLSKIDTPAKAALLPTLEPAVQLGVFTGLVMSLAGSATGAAMPVVMHVATKAADKSLNVTYTLDASAQSPLNASGDYAGLSTATTLTVDPMNLNATLNEALGSPDHVSKLTVGYDSKKNALTATGKLGDVDVDLTVGAVGEKLQNITGYHVAGTIGGQAYCLNSSFEVAPNAKGDDVNLPAKICARGKLGDQDISKDYTLSANTDPSNPVVHISGSGTTAGIAQQVQVDISLPPPSTPPSGGK